MIGLWSSLAELTPLPERQRAIAIVLASTILLLVVELVRRRKLREEYSWVWVAVSIVLLAIAIDEDVILFLSQTIGSATGTSTLFFGAILFLTLLALQVSVRLSRLTHRQRILTQRLALLEQELEVLRGSAGPQQPADAVPRAPTAPDTVPLRTPPPVGATAALRAKDSGA